MLTHYGTEIWHHDGSDARFRRFNRDAAPRHLLQRGAARARAGAGRAAARAPPSSTRRSPTTSGPCARRSARPCARDSRPAAGALLLNVKRLHPLADQATLLRAPWPRPRARAGRGAAHRGDGRDGRRRSRRRRPRLGLGDAVRFLGLVPNERGGARCRAAADLFVLSSVLEATPTVALEALACGTPVVSTDNPGGLELREIFGDDVAVVPKRDAGALARAVLDRLARPGAHEPRRPPAASPSAFASTAWPSGTSGSTRRRSAS